METLSFLHPIVFQAGLVASVVTAVGVVIYSSQRAKALTIREACATLMFGLALSLWGGAPVSTYTLHFETFIQQTWVGLLDNSGSMTRCLKDAEGLQDYTLPEASGACATGRTAAEIGIRGFQRFAEQRAYDQVTATVFEDKVNVLTQPRALKSKAAWITTSSTATALRKFDTVAAGGGTDLDVALSEAVAQLEQEGLGEKHLVIFTDGEDIISEAKRDELGERIAKAGIKVYWLVPVATDKADYQTLDFAKLVEDLNGRVYEYHNVTEALRILNDISARNVARTAWQSTTVTFDHADGTILLVLVSLMGCALAFSSRLPHRANNNVGE